MPRRNYSFYVDRVKKKLKAQKTQLKYRKKTNFAKRHNTDHPIADHCNYSRNPDTAETVQRIDGSTALVLPVVKVVHPLMTPAGHCSDSHSRDSFLTSDESSQASTSTHVHTNTF